MNRINWTQVAVFAVVVVLVFAVGIGVVSILWGGGYGMMGGYRGYDPSGMMGGIGGQFGWLLMLPMCLFPLGFLALLVVGIVWLVQAAGKKDSKEEETALEILRKRYARGEITKEEFDQMKMDL